MARIDGLRIDGRRQFMDAADFLTKLGDRGFLKAAGKYVDHGGAIGVNGVRVVLLSREQAAHDYPGHNRPHRLRAECDCGRLVPVGRLAQHRAACKADLFADKEG